MALISQNRTLLVISTFLYLHPCIAQSWSEDTLKSLSLDQKIGQLFMAAVRLSEQVDPLTKTTLMPPHMAVPYVEDLIKQYHIGGIIYLGRHTSSEQLPVNQLLQEQSAIPLLVGQDFEWGLGMRLTDCTSFPRAAELGNRDDTDLTYHSAHTIGKQCKTLGVHINFAPVVDINTNPNNPIIGTRSFGNTPEMVIKHATAFAQGLLDAGIIPCIKHFPGHGDTSIDSHIGLPTIDHPLQRLSSVELAPFIALINHHIPAIMIAHLTVPALDATDTPSSLSYSIVTELLRNTYHFDGLIITDALDMGALQSMGSAADIALQAFKAGNDILLASTDIPGAHARIKQEVEHNSELLKELDAHVLRILKAKEMALLLNK